MMNASEIAGSQPLLASQSQPVGSPPAAAAARAPNPTETNTVRMAAQVLTNPESTHEERTGANETLASMLHQKGGKVSNVGNELTKLGISIEQLIAKDSNGNRLIDQGQIKQLLEAKISDATQVRQVQQHRQQEEQEGAVIDSCINKCALSDNDSEGIRELNQKMAAFGWDIDDLEAHLMPQGKQMSPEVERGYQEILGKVIDIQHQEREQAVTVVKGSSIFQVIEDPVNEVIELRSSINDAKATIASENEKLTLATAAKADAERALEEIMDGIGEGDPTDENVIREHEAALNDANNTITLSEAKIEENEGLLSTHEEKIRVADQALANKMAEQGLAETDLRDLLRKAGMGNEEIACLNGSKLQDKVDLSKGQEILENMSKGDKRKLEAALEKILSSSPDSDEGISEEGYKDLAKLMNKHELTPQGLEQAVKAGQLVSSPKLLKKTKLLANSDELKQAMQEDVKGQKGNEAIFDAAQNLINAGSDPAKKGEAAKELAKAMLKNGTKTADLPKLLEKMGIDPKKIDNQDLQKVEAAREVEKQEKSDERTSSLLKLAGTVACVAAVVFGVALMAVGVGVCIANPIAMPLGIMLVGAGLCIALGGPTVAGFLYLDKEEQKAKAEAKAEEDAKRKPFLGNTVTPPKPQQTSNANSASNTFNEASSLIATPSTDPEVRRLQAELATLTPKAKALDAKKVKAEDLSEDDQMSLLDYENKTRALKEAIANSEIASAAQQQSASSSSGSRPPLNASGSDSDSDDLYLDDEFENDDPANPRIILNDDPDGQVGSSSSFEAGAEAPTQLASMSLAQLDNDISEIDELLESSEMDEASAEYKQLHDRLVALMAEKENRL